MKILLTDSGNIGNTGDAAILESTVILLEREIKSADITVLGDYPEGIEELIGRPSNRSLFDMKPLGSTLKRFQWLGSNLLLIIGIIAIALLRKVRVRLPIYYLPVKKEVRNVLKLYEEANVVISCGGSFISDIYYRAMPFFLLPLWMSNVIGKKTVIYGQSLGPFEKWWTRIISKRVLRKLDLIILRDNFSKLEIEKLGLENLKVVVGTDVAFTQPYTDKLAAKNILSIHSLKQPFDKRLNIGASVLKWTYPGACDPELQHQNYLETITKFLEYLINEHTAQVWLFCTNTSFGGNRMDDVAVAMEVRDRIREKQFCNVIDKALSPRDMKGAIGHMDYFIATRMHSCIFATSQSIPTISITYEFKSFEYMKSLGLEEYTCNIEDIDLTDLINIWSKVFDDNEQVKRKLKENILILQRKANNSATILRDELLSD